jgi:hypothetical protein
MIRHIVMWRLQEQAHGNDRATNARLIREKLEALRGRIPGLLAIEVGTDFSATEQSADLVLTTTHESRAALDAYQTHTEHQAVVPFIRAACCERRVVDYEA